MHPIKAIVPAVRKTRRFFLGHYRRSGTQVYQKARIQLGIFWIGLVVIPGLLIQNYLLYGWVHWAMVAAATAGTGSFIVFLFLLRSGRYLLTGHAFLLLTLGIIWFWMFFGVATPLNRLDTVALVLSALILTPLITNPTGTAVHFGLNTGMLLLFLNTHSDLKGFTVSVRHGFALDALIAFISSGFICYLLLKTSERAERDLERSNARLEELVRRQTRGLDHARLQLEISRDAMHRDMDMARHVQFHLFHPRTPRSAQWDCAHLFQPCALVSGDFFDFYAKNGELSGAGLFDVSGHGVSSGLITVLARSILLRKFETLAQEPLSRVLEAANAELMIELKNVNNYLTGVLVRCGETFVDSVNAGHPDPMVCDARGTVRSINAPDRSHRGLFLGKEFLRGDYPALRTPIEPGDTVLLFSDGVTDATNTAGERYGLARLRAVFGDTAAVNAPGARLEAIMADFYRFTGHQAPDDDLTMVLLARG